MSAVAAAPRATALGTYVELAVTDPAAIDPAQRLLRAELRALDRACSRFRADSDLSRVNAGAGRPVPVGARLRDAVRIALNAAEDTEGLVDPTLGSWIDAAGYDRDFSRLPVDGPAVRPAAPLASPAWSAVRVDERAGTIFVPAGCQLDLGATAKAHGADRAVSAIARRLGVGVLVSLGGDVALSGPAPAGGWAVRVVTSTVESASGDQGETVLLATGGVATSSPTARRWRRGGQVQHHILDPRTGVPAATCWSAVSVVAPSCVEANTVATAAVVLGAHAVRWVGGTGLPARLVGVEGGIQRLGEWPEPGRWS